MVRSAVKVHLRTRPTAKFAEDNLRLDEAQQTLSLAVKRREDFGVVNHQKEEFSFRFTGDILHNASQEQVYATVGEEAVVAALDGYNSTARARSIGRSVDPSLTPPTHATQTHTHTHHLVLLRLNSRSLGLLHLSPHLFFFLFFCLFHRAHRSTAEGGAYTTQAIIQSAS